MAMEPVPLGKLAQSGAKRDAVHIAVIPLVTVETCNPGQHIFIEQHERCEGKGCRTCGEGFIATINGITPIGIVDPFLKEPVQPGERIYICLYPNTITSLNHHWTHPSIKE